MYFYINKYQYAHLYIIYIIYNVVLSFVKVEHWIDELTCSITY